MSAIQNDKTCPNCSYTVSGNFCANCGQKTHLHRDSFFHMVTHFVSDYFHYDHKFCKTLKALLLRPGSLSVAYKEGKRSSFLNPIQLYILISAVTFLLFYKAFKPDVVEDKDGFSINWIIGNAGVEVLDKYNYYDTIAMKQVLRIGTKAIMDTAAEQARAIPFSFSATYGLVQFYKYFTQYTYRHHLFLYSQALSKLLNTYIHSIPKLFFLLMPWLGLLLQLFFYDRKLYYTDHAIMSLHFHSFLFLVVCASLLLYYIPGMPFKIPVYLLFFSAIAYLYLSCITYYKKYWLTTLLICVVVWFVYLATIWVVSIVNLFLTMAIT